MLNPGVLHRHARRGAALAQAWSVDAQCRADADACSHLEETAGWWSVNAPAAQMASAADTAVMKGQFSRMLPPIEALKRSQ